ncbi:DUF4260 domain-containing protein [Compostibacter hankyongensis]|uniref:DUF4260 domain-containing protein n=1 Tax=Compostibacter hankyongensis TaxID=1007089 RepID=A0ABP8G848_9BACT
MKTILILEELACFALAVLAFYLQCSLAWWWFPALILAPDISMLGYLAGNKTGACVYNFFHHKGTAIALYLAGWYTGHQWLLFCGILLFAHSSMDRIFGYGLKYATGFSDTHLGKIGRKPV